MSERYGWRVWLMLAALGVLYLLAAATEVQAQVGLTITLPEQPPFPRGPAGSVHLQATVTDHGLPIGAMCDVDVATSNVDSVHPDTNVIVTSNGDQVFAFDVEDGEGAVHNTAGTLTIGDTITVAVQLGADRVSSLGMEIIFTCNPSTEPPSTTTTSTEPPSSTTTTTSNGATTTTDPPVTTTTMPVGCPLDDGTPAPCGVDSGFGAPGEPSIWPVTVLGIVALLFIGAMLYAAFRSRP